ncbi:hypothetical protein [Thermotoga caldifontis]|nr:hypothetical protein [Thermotoga caldifontis]
MQDHKRDELCGDRKVQVFEELDEIKKQTDRLIDVLKFGLLER